MPDEGRKLSADDVRDEEDRTLLVRCVGCENESRLSEWNLDAELPCDDCGSHMAVACPNCGDGYQWSQTAAEIVEAPK
jgi:DNA-directed RNA polymerase subunit RPC12/RpoP